MPVGIKTITASSTTIYLYFISVATLCPRTDTAYWIYLKKKPLNTRMLHPCKPLVPFTIWMVGRARFETTWLKVRCSTNWA